MQSGFIWTHRLWAPLAEGRAGGGGRGALPLLLSAGPSSSDELEDDESESESELDESELEELDESESDELSEEDESSARRVTACLSMLLWEILPLTPLCIQYAYTVVAMLELPGHSLWGCSVSSCAQVMLSAKVQSLQDVQDARNLIRNLSERGVDVYFQQGTHLKRRMRSPLSHYRQLAGQ